MDERAVKPNREGCCINNEQLLFVRILALVCRFIFCIRLSQMSLTNEATKRHLHSKEDHYVTVALFLKLPNSSSYIWSLAGITVVESGILGGC